MRYQIRMYGIIKYYLQICFYNSEFITREISLKIIKNATMIIFITIIINIQHVQYISTHNGQLLILGALKLF